MNLDSIQNIYIIGIEGAGTSALAMILKSQGKNIVGVDEGDHFYFDVLKEDEIKVFHEFDKNNLKKAFGDVEKIDLVIYSTAVTPEQNEELAVVVEGNVSHFKVLSYPQALSMVFNTSNLGIAVCGTHGKTTTTAMLATAMKATGAKLTALVGSKVSGWSGGVLVTGDDFFVIEADEYQNKLQYYNPKGVILTSVDYDHPDFFKTKDEYTQVFKDFVGRIPKDGFLVAYAGDKDVVEVAKSAECEVIFYDMDNEDDLKMQLPGQHNLLNATAALKVVEKLNLDKDVASKTLESFQGTARRFEIKGEYNKAIIVDDYAHHPVEVQATLQAAREKYPDKKIKCIFHPHTFTRTEALLDDFAESFRDADEVYLLDIFGSAREEQGGVSSDDLMIKIKKACSDYNKSKVIENLHTIDEAVEYFKNNLQSDEVLITMGAGDVYLIGDKLIEG